MDFESYGEKALMEVKEEREVNSKLKEIEDRLSVFQNPEITQVLAVFHITVKLTQVLAIFHNTKITQVLAVFHITTKLTHVLAIFHNIKIAQVLAVFHNTEIMQVLAVFHNTGIGRLSQHKYWPSFTTLK